MKFEILRKSSCWWALEFFNSDTAVSELESWKANAILVSSIWIFLYCDLKALLVINDFLLWQRVIQMYRVFQIPICARQKEEEWFGHAFRHKVTNFKPHFLTIEQFQCPSARGLPTLGHFFGTPCSIIVKGVIATQTASSCDCMQSCVGACKVMEVHARSWNYKNCTNLLSFLDYVAILLSVVVFLTMISCSIFSFWYYTFFSKI